jgi:hypothetical protein
MSGRGSAPLVVEPDLEEFFVSGRSVCVYVNAHGHSYRVRFDSLNGPGSTSTPEDAAAVEAVAAAEHSRERHLSHLRPLFERARRSR